MRHKKHMIWAISGITTWLWFIPGLQAQPAARASENTTKSAPATQRQGAPQQRKIAPDRELLRQGMMLLRDRACLTCHSLNGARLTGPTLYRLYGKTRKVLTKGKSREVVADEAYLRRSILEPEFDKVKGYESIFMPPLKLSPQEVTAMVAAIKHLTTTTTDVPGQTTSSLLQWALLGLALLVMLGLILALWPRSVQQEPDQR